eukprot:CAMPEP_0182864566 /NCGR_PEP_ID=MMETSP0034_2-20130328/7236_1 /TAXON_ID=156128 /ORGANISM="Nephroselmis pyriformis, Strain CCMP717" /LENGTH=62 /DNA_ID=CAMNT_0024996825 /DNA_START=406 /DNA_END=591 /DNA_ORIENTATION=+
MTWRCLPHVGHLCSDVDGSQQCTKLHLAPAAHVATKPAPQHRAQELPMHFPSNPPVQACGAP